MQRYYSRPIAVDTIQFTGEKENLAEVLRLSYLIGVRCPNDNLTDLSLHIPTPSGNKSAKVGWWIIHDQYGLDCLSDEDFHRKYGLKEDS